MLRDGKVHLVGAGGKRHQDGDHVLIPGLENDAAHVTAHLANPAEGDDYTKSSNAERAGFHVERKYDEANRRMNYVAKAVHTLLTALYTQIKDGAK